MEPWSIFTPSLQMKLSGTSLSSAWVVCGQSYVTTWLGCSPQLFDQTLI